MEPGFILIVAAVFSLALVVLAFVFCLSCLDLLRSIKWQIGESHKALKAIELRLAGAMVERD